MTNKILIVGNGFDIDCELATSYKNFVDMMDELNITKTNLTAPAVDDDPKHLTPEEREFMKQQGIL